MSAVVSAVVSADVDELVEAIFADRHVVTRRELAAATGVGLDTIKTAVRSGALTELRVGARTCRYAPAAVRRWLLADSASGV